EAIEAFTERLWHTTSHSGETVEEYWTLFCTDMRTKIFSALATVLQKLKSCLHSEEEYISDFVAGWYNNSFEKQCTNGNETTVGYIDTIFFGPPCEKLSPPDVDERFEKCFSPSSIIKNFQTKNFILRKEDLCL
ncbi:hypothetical protein ILUMI_14506, partial [Ignelater luminosus]